MTLAPWLQASYQAVGDRIDSGRFPHAILIQGGRGLGKLPLALAIAKRLLCETQRADDQCSACQLFDRQTHSDFYRVDVAEGKTVIDIESIRDLSENLATTSMLGDRKVAVISPADAMNTAASNALLKTLEEPTAGSFLILCSDRPAKLPATIRSRCQKLSLSVPQSSEVEAWLREKGVPFEAWMTHQPYLAQDVEYAERQSLIRQQLDLLIDGQADGLAVADNLAKLPLSFVLDVMCMWVGSAMLKSSGAQQVALSRVQVQIVRFLADELTGLNARATLESILLNFAKQR